MGFFFVGFPVSLGLPGAVIVHVSEGKACAVFVRSVSQG